MCFDKWIHPYNPYHNQYRDHIIPNSQGLAFPVNHCIPDTDNSDLFAVILFRLPNLHGAHVPLSAWLSLSIIFLRISHFSVCISSLLLCSGEQYSTAYTSCLLFLNWLTDICFQLWDIIKTLLSICALVPVKTCVYFCWISAYEWNF